VSLQPIILCLTVVPFLTSGFPLHQSAICTHSSILVVIHVYTVVLCILTLYSVIGSNYISEKHVPIFWIEDVLIRAGTL